MAHILIIDDNPADAKLTEELFNDGPYPAQLTVIDNGNEAIKFLKNNQKPDLILLDLNLPKKDGREILSDIKTDAELKTIPVIILTTSSSDKDITQCYELHANGYITKPTDLDEFAKTIRAIEEFWFNTVKRP